MILIHTADWHLGQTFFGYDRIKEHSNFLAWLTATIKEKKADALLIAGDIFDTPNPSASAQKSLYKFIRDVTQENPQLRIIITAGNHDSGARLEAPDTLMETMGVTVRGTIQRTADASFDYERHIIALSAEICCVALPYLRQGDYPTAESYSEGVRHTFSALMEKARERYKQIILMGHLFATGGNVSSDDRSERTVVGGLDSVELGPLSSEATYIALGHLHKAQSLGPKKNICYSGAPLPMSFAERCNRQSVTMLTVDNDGLTTEKLEIPGCVKLLSIGVAPLTQVIKEIENLPVGEADDQSPYLEIKIEISEPEPTLRAQIEKALEGKAVRLTRIEAVAQQGASSIEAPLTYDEVKSIDPLRLAIDFFSRSYGHEEMPENMQKLLREVITEISNEDFSN